MRCSTSHLHIVAAVIHGLGKRPNNILQRIIAIGLEYYKFRSTESLKNLWEWKGRGEAVGKKESSRPGEVSNNVFQLTEEKHFSKYLTPLLAIGTLSADK